MVVPVQVAVTLSAEAGVQSAHAASPPSSMIPKASAGDRAIAPARTRRAVKRRRPDRPGKFSHVDLDAPGTNDWSRTRPKNHRNPVPCQQDSPGGTSCGSEPNLGRSQIASACTCAATTVNRRHQREASTTTDTRRTWFGAETACQPGRKYRFSTLGPLTFNPALQRDGSERRRTASAYASSMEKACLKLVARVGSTETDEASIARLTR